MRELSTEQVDSLRTLQTNNAFKLYQNCLEELFNNEYKKLRNCKKSDSTYSRLCGFLDGLEKAMNLVEIETDEQ